MPGFRAIFFCLLTQVSADRTDVTASRFDVTSAYGDVVEDEVTRDVSESRSDVNNQSFTLGKWRMMLLQPTFVTPCSSEPQ